MTAPFDAIGCYYDLLYQDKDYVGEVDYILKLLKRYGLAGVRLLEFGSGTGIHGSLLAELGYQVHGIDRSSTMVSASRTSPGFSCQVGDIRSSFINKTFDAVLSFFHVVSYQVSNVDVQAMFANAARHLDPGGLFLFDVWYTPAVLAMRPAVRLKKFENAEVKITRVAEPVVRPNENRVDVNYTIIAENRTTGSWSQFDEVHSMRHFSLPELDLFAAGAGFQRLAAEEWMTGAPPSESTWGVCLVLRKS